MQRYTVAGQIKPGQGAAFRAALGQAWPDLCTSLESYKVRNFSIWQAEDLVFLYGESSENTLDVARLISVFSSTVSFFPYPMRLMYSDIGIIREDKSLIRHRVFMTKLVPGSEEEYKHRHDVLSAENDAARGGAPDPGPDSNFTIWSSGGYIFGYDEIDVTMEQPMTEKQKASTIAWETRMFEIMSWITNDCDWISGEHHPSVQRIAHRG